jgi:hypothetical protein
VKLIITDTETGKRTIPFELHELDCYEGEGNWIILRNGLGGEDYYVSYSGEKPQEYTVEVIDETN